MEVFTLLYSVCISTVAIYSFVMVEIVIIVYLFIHYDCRTNGWIVLKVLIFEKG